MLNTHTHCSPNAVLRINVLCLYNVIMFVRVVAFIHSCHACQQKPFAAASEPLFFPALASSALVSACFFLRPSFLCQIEEKNSVEHCSKNSVVVLRTGGGQVVYSRRPKMFLFLKEKRKKVQNAASAIVRKGDGRRSCICLGVLV